LGSKRRQALLVAGLLGLLLLVFAGLVWANTFLTSRFPGGENFLILWMGARGFLNGSGPYSSGIAQSLQTLIYGHTAIPGAYPYFVDYPFQILLFFLPFGRIQNFALARAVWMAGLELALIILMLLNFRLVDWQLRPLTLGVVLCFSLFSFYSVFPVMQSEVTIWLAVLFAVVLLALRSGLDEVAGALLVLTAYKWEVTGLFLLFVFVWTVSHRRWRVWSTFLMTLLVLLAIAFILYPGWFLPYLRAVLANLRVGQGYSPSDYFIQHWPAIGANLSRGLTLVLGIILFLEWRATRRTDFRHFLWVACLTLAATPLLGFRSDPANFAVLFLPLMLVLQVIDQRWNRIGRLIFIAVLISIFGVWYWYWKAVESGASNPEFSTYLFLPVFLFVALYWLRWWAIQPPRVWYDSVKEMQRS
jgi:hypothetical protein